MADDSTMQTISEEEFWLELRKLILQDDAPGTKQQALKLAAELKGWSRGSAKDKAPIPTDLPKPLQEVAKRLRRKPIKKDAPDEYGLVSGTGRMEGERVDAPAPREAEIAESPATPVVTE